MTLSVDPDEYAVPSDGQVVEEFTVANDSIVDIYKTFSDNPIVDRKDNVIKINFKTKTKGNA